MIGENKMKKLCSLLLVICLIFSLSACGGNETTTDNETGSSTTQNQTDVTDTSSTEQNTDYGSSDNDVPSSTTSTPSTTTKPETSNPSTTTKPETSTPSTTTHTHSYSGATCTAPAKCSCGATKGAALGHTIVIDKAVPPTCTESGLTEGQHCSVCNTIIQKQQTIDAEHKLSGDTCSVCHQRIPVGKWDASSKQDGSIFVCMYGTNNKDEYIIEVVGNGEMKDFDINGPHAPWAGTWSASKKVASLSFIGSITYIGAATFPYLEVQDLLLPNTLTHIGAFAFWGCETLKSVSLPSGLQIIGECAFSGCGINTLTIPNNITIKRQSLSCPIDTLYLPQNVIIEDFGLSWMNDHREMEVFYNGTKEQWKTTGNVEMFFYDDQIVHCTDGDYLTPGHHCH